MLKTGEIRTRRTRGGAVENRGDYMNNGLRLLAAFQRPALRVHISPVFGIRDKITTSYYNNLMFYRNFEEYLLFKIV
jgi:hypothetical protein